MLIEEVPKKTNANSSTIYFSSSVNLTARPNARINQSNHDDVVQPQAKKTKINYNLNDLMNAQIQTNDSNQVSGPLKSSQQLSLERLATKRVLEMSKEGNITNFELPKNFEYNKQLHGKSNSSRQGTTPGTKKILSARRNLNLYFEEERDLMAINSILSLNYQYLDQLDSYNSTATKGKNHHNDKLFRPRIKLCCICSNISNYARCGLCGLFYCSIRCNRVHQDSRCN